MKRVHECNYDDSSRKTHTQTLREKVLALEAKVRELESTAGANTGTLAGSSATGTSATTAWLSCKTINTIDADRAIFTHSPQPMLGFHEDDSFQMLEPGAVQSGVHDIWTVASDHSTEYPYSYDAFDIPLDLPSSASSSSDGSMSRSLSMSSTAPPLSVVPPSLGVSFSPFNDTSAGQQPSASHHLHPHPHSPSQSIGLDEYDNGSHPKVPISREMHHTL